MTRHNFVCPCCGHSYVLCAVNDDIVVECGEVVSAVAEDAIEKLASEMGIECGALKGGEKIG